MAIALTNLTPANGTAGSTTDRGANSGYTTASFTALGDTWVILSFTLSGTNANAATINLSSSASSGSLGTLTQIASVAPTTGFRHIVAAAWAGSSGFTGTISMTATNITSTGCAWSVVQAAGLDSTTPYITSNVQTVSNGTAVSSRTLTMNATSGAQNRTFASWQTTNNSAGTITPPSGYAELCESSYSTPSNKIETIWSTSAFNTSPSVTEDSTYTISGIAFELNGGPIADFGVGSEAATAAALTYPAALYQETFDEGVNGATLSTSYGGPAVSYTLGSGGTAAYSSSFSGLAAFFNLSSQSDIKYVSLPVSSGSSSPYYVRAYFRLPGGFGGASSLYTIARAPGVSQIYINSNTGQLNISGNTSTSVVADGNWWRIEWDIDPTSGSRKVRLYTGARLDSIVPTESISSNDGAGLTFQSEIQFGAFGASGVIPSIYWDNIAVSTAGPVGPYGFQPSITAADTATSAESARVLVTPPANVYEETFDEGVNAATLSSSYGGAATYLPGTGGSLFYDSSTRTGTGLCASFGLGSTTDAKWAQLSASGSGPFYIRFYYRANNGVPGGGSFTIAQAVGLGNMIINVNGKLQLYGGGSAATSSTLSNGSWWRIEWDVNPSTGANTVRLYSSPDSRTETETLTYNTGPVGTVSALNFGTAGSGNGLVSTSIDDIAISTVGPPGPYGQPIGPATDTATSAEAASVVVTPPTGPFLYTENFESGTNGSSVTTANTTFNAVSGTNLAFSSATAYQGSLSAKTNSATVANYGSFTISTTTTHYSRFYLRWETTPDNGIVIAAANSSTTTRNQLASTPGRQLGLWNAASVSSSMATQLSLNTWYRVEWDIVAATQTVRVYLGDSNTPLETLSQVASGSSFDTMRYGNDQASGATFGYYLDAIAGSATVQPSALPTKTAADTATSIEAASVALAVTAADTGSSAESASAVNLVTPISSTDTAAGADSSALAVTTNATDTSTTVDAASLVRANTATVSDTIGLGDTVSPAPGYATNVSDGVGLGDSSVTSAGFALTVSDAMPVIEDVAVGGSQSASDGVGLADTVSATADYARASADTAGLTDSVGFGAGSSRSTSDSAGLSDSVSISFSSGIIISDSAGLSDRVSTPGIFADQISISDSSTQSASYVRSISDTAGLTEATFLAGTYSRGVDDAGLADTLFFDIVRAPADSAGISDGFSWEGTRTFSDTAGLADGSSPSAAYSGTAPADAMPVADTTTTAARYDRAHAETTLGGDSTALEVSIVIVDRVKVLEDVSQAGSYALTVTDVTGTSDSTVRAAGVSRTLQDTLTLSDVGLGVGYGLALVDLLQVIDTADILPGPGGSDTFTAVDIATVDKRNLGIHLVRLTVTDLEDAQVMRVGIYRS